MVIRWLFWPVNFVDIKSYSRWVLNQHKHSLAATSRPTPPLSFGAHFRTIIRQNDSCLAEIEPGNLLAELMIDEAITSDFDGLSFMVRKCGGLLTGAAEWSFGSPKEMKQMCLCCISCHDSGLWSGGFPPAD